MKKRTSSVHGARVVLRFAVASLLVFLAIGVAIFELSSRKLEAQELSAAKYHSQFVAESVLRSVLTSQDLDFLVPVRGDRYTEMRGFVERNVLTAPLLHLVIWRSDGTVIFSDEERLVGRNVALPALAARAFTSRHSVNATVEGNSLLGSPGTMVETFVPIFLDLDRGGIPVAVTEVDQDYAGIRSASHALLQELVPAFLIGLAALYLLLLPIVRSLSRRLIRQHEKLERLVETERHGADERRRLLEKVLQISEDERKLFAAELHDGPVQRLATLGLQLHRARSRIGRGDPASADELLQKAQGGLEAEVQTLRRMMGRLRPPAIEQRGLVEAIRDHVDALRAETGMEFDMECELPGSLDEQVEMVLYRVTLEAIQNVVKHAQATHTNVRMHTENGSVQLEVQDDGRGFDLGPLADPASGENFGLLAMRERVESVGGHLSIETRRGAGTRVLVSVPRTRGTP
jgi:two-component system, NarL family, sensor kinase